YTELLGEAILHILASEFEEALAALNGVLQMSPDASPAHHLLGHVYGCLKNHREEVECYRRAMKLRSDYPHIHYSLGVAYWLLGREKKAMSAFHRAVPLAPEFSVAEFWLTFTFERLKRYPSGSRGSNDKKTGDKKSVEKNRVLAQAFYMTGMGLIEYGFNSEARQAFKKSVELRPDFAEAYYQLGAVHIKKLRNSNRAAKYLETAEQLFLRQNELQRATLAHQLYHPKDEVVEKNKAAEEWLKEGLRLQKSGLYQSAVDAYKAAIAFKRDFLDAYYNMGVAYGSLKELGVETLESAVGAFKQSVRLNPDFIHGHVALAAAYIRGGEFRKAIETLNGAVKVDPRESNVYYYLGVANRALDRLEEAVSALRQAAARKPDSIQVQFLLGRTLADCKKYQDACDAFLEVVRIKPDFADGHYMLGNLYLDKLSESEKATTHLKKAEKLLVKLEDFDRLAHVRQILAHQPA
ncbi:MAG: tetratricopeptide repeat protein, partial [Nitrospinae bacterium]|nr:tetratricopeptide repeat protein [Nitrospinota bacterium]